MSRFLGGISAVMFTLVLPCRLDAQAVEAGPVRIEPTGRVQVQFNTTSVGEEDLPPAVDEIASSTFEARRVRFGAELTLAGWITGKLEADFAGGSAALQDAWVNLGFGPRLGLRIGQFKKPFSRIELISSTRYVAIERGVRIRGLADAARGTGGPGTGQAALPILDEDVILGESYAILDGLGYVGRDIGVAAHGRLGRVDYEIGVFNGSGTGGRDDGDGKSFAARAVYQPIADAPLSIGAAASYRELVFEGLLIDGFRSGELDGTAFEIDAEWGGFRRPGTHLVVEATAGDDFATGGTFLGAQGAAAYFVPTGAAGPPPAFAFLRSIGGDRLEGVEPVVRVSYGDPDTARPADHGWLFTPGLNLYFLGRNRLMFGWDAFSSGRDGLGAEHAFRAQAQLHF